MIRTILFDWGDTLMVELPEYANSIPDRSMADWPKVEAVNGAAEALLALKGKYQLAIASNADVSSGPDTIRAMARVGLDHYFKPMPTSRDLGVRKPDPIFFEKLLAILEAQPEETLMIGDSYKNDILGAKNAGLKAAWFNPEQSISPTGIPDYDIEVNNLASLPDLLHKGFLPDITECLQWLHWEEGDEVLQRHCQAVARCAYWMAWNIRKLGDEVDPLLTHRGALLHDLDKRTSHSQGLKHGEYAAHLLQERGYPKLGEIARRHLITNLTGDASLFWTWEEKLVNYADKLVEGDRFVGLEERLASLMARYPSFAPQMQACRPVLIALEAEVCERLGISTRELYQRLTDHIAY